MVPPPLWLSTNAKKTQTPDTAPPAYSSQRSPSPDETTYTPDTRRSVGGNGTSSVRLEDEPSNPAMPTMAPPAVPMSYDELKAKLAEAQATITSYAQEGGLRMRKVAKGETSNETVNEIAHRVQTTQGVPLQVVAALCLVSFLLAYLFF
jgi:hypothetical protein